MRQVACGLAALIMACGFALDPETATPFAEHAHAAKASMMSDPATALSSATSAEAEGTSTLQAATALWLQAEALTRLDRPSDALERVASARSLASTRDTKFSGDLSLAAARAYSKLEDQAAALAAYQDAHETFRVVGDQRGQALALTGIGNLYKRARRWDRALDYFDEAAATYAGDDALTLVLNNNRGSVLSRRGNHQDARLAFSSNLPIAERLGTPYSIANTQLMLADVALDLGDLGAARAHADRAAAYADAPGADTWHRLGLFVRTRLAVAEGDDAEAEALLGAIFAGWDGVTTHAANERSHRIAARFYERRGDLPRALAHTKALAEIDTGLNGAAAANSFNLLNAEFEASNRELEIERLNTARLEAELQARLTKERTRDLVTSIVGLAAASALLLVLWHLRSAWAASRKLEEANADLTEANDAKSRFLANTSHEIRTPLNAILGMAEALLVLDDEPLREDQRGRIETIERSGKLLLSIVTDILDVAKMEDGKLKPQLAPADMGDVAADVRDMHAANAGAKGLAIETDVPGALPRYVTDARLVTQAIGNLVSNAIKFTDEGSVRVTIEETEDGFAAAVSDTGLGIPSDRLSDVFEAFTQVEGGANRRFGGTGLGLAIVRDVAHLLGGSVDVDSTPNEGSTFTLRIPAETASVTDAPAEAATGQDAPDEADLSALRVLLAEDNPVNVAVVRALLGGAVASLDVAMDGESAVERVRLQPYDVVLMDNQMPGMSGGEATEAIRAMPGRADTPIIGVTADVAPTVRRSLIASGMDMIVAKPVSRTALIGAIRSVTASTQRPEAWARTN